MIFFGRSVPNNNVCEWLDVLAYEKRMSNQEIKTFFDNGVGFSNDKEECLIMNYDKKEKLVEIIDFPEDGEGEGCTYLDFIGSNPPQLNISEPQIFNDGMTIEDQERKLFEYNSERF